MKVTEMMMYEMIRTHTYILYRPTDVYVPKFIEQAIRGKNDKILVLCKVCFVDRKTVKFSHNNLLIKEQIKC